MCVFGMCMCKVVVVVLHVKMLPVVSAALQHRLVPSVSVRKAFSALVKGQSCGYLLCACVFSLVAVEQ